MGETSHTYLKRSSFSVTIKDNFDKEYESPEIKLKQVDIGFLDEVKGDRAGAAYKKIKDDENEAAGGIGFIFQ